MNGIEAAKLYIDGEQKMIPKESSLENQARAAYIKRVQHDCCVLNNFMERLKSEKEIRLIGFELEVVMRFSPLFNDLHIDVEDGIMRRA